MNTRSKLVKVSTSLINHARRGATINAYRSQQLIERFADVRDAAINEDIWVEFCQEKGWSPECDASDFFA